MKKMKDDTPRFRARATVTRLSDVEPREVSWLWPNKIAIGKLTMIAGDPGLGKSFLTCDFAARVSTGQTWPDGSGKAPIGSMIMLNCEDELEDTIRPRLDAADADSSRIVSIDAIESTSPDGRTERMLDLSRDVEHLESIAKELGDCRLIVIDPISAYLGKTDSHKNADVRSVLAPLSQLAIKLKCAIVAITHLRKGEGAAIYRTMGSLAFVAAARAAWAVCKDPDDPDGRLFMPVKNNIAADSSGLRFRIDNVGRLGQPAVSWSADPVTGLVDDLMNGDRKDGAVSKLQEAENWIFEYLGDEEKPSKDLLDDAKEFGISSVTLRRAFRRMGGKPKKTGMEGGWVWKLPEDDQNQ